MNMGAISKCGDAMMRTVLFETAQSMLTRTIEWSWLKGWGMKIARHRGMRQLRPRSQSCRGPNRRWAAEDCSGVPAILLHLLVRGYLTVERGSTASPR